MSSYSRPAERGAEEMVVYRTIIADPPLDSGAQRGAPVLQGGAAATISDHERAEIGALQVPAAKQAHLWLWAISQHVDWGYAVARAWGFEPWTVITWCKPGLGVGRFQCNTEHVLVCRKGPRHGNPFGPTGGTWFTWPRGRHSEKPEEFYRLVETVSPGPYLEMFARVRRPGWDAFGDEVEGSICLAR